MWREPESLSAVEGYVRIALGAAFMGVLLYLVVANRLDILLMVKIIAGLSGTFHVGTGINRVLAAYRDTRPPPNVPPSTYLSR